MPVFPMLSWSARLQTATLLLAWALAPSDPHLTGLDTITEDDLRADLLGLATAPLEGRDSPSRGLERAADHIEQRMRAAGLQGAGPNGSFRLPFERRVPAPVPEGCRLEVDGVQATFTFGVDFVPIWGADGEAQGQLAFLGFGIRDDEERYNEIRGRLDGRVALVFEGEPRHKRKFEGPEVTPAAELYRKLQHLQAAGVIGVLVVRRVPAEDGADDQRATLPEPARLSFRHTWANWSIEAPFKYNPIRVPALEIAMDTASLILGEDAAALAQRIDKQGKPLKYETPERTITLAARSEQRNVAMDNVVGIVPGTDPELADEYVVIGAHYDHVGVDPRGRIGFGADDNASGTTAMLEVAEALRSAGPRRSILACAFAAEEDQLAGSKAFCADLPVPRDKLVAMINLDMVGRGEADEVVAIGVLRNPGFDKILSRARKLSKTRIKKIVTRQGQELFQRSDHYSFHEIGVPALFLFEGLPLSRNADYHTWRDTIDRLDIEKIARTTRLTYNAAWILATDDERLRRPR